MKKLLSVLLAFILVFTVSASVAEAQRPEETLLHNCMRLSKISKTRRYG